MGPVRRWSLRARLMLLVGSALLPALAVSAGTVWFFSGQQVDQIRDQMTRTSKALAAAMDSQLENSIHAARALGRSRALAAGDLAQFYVDAQQVLAQEPTWVTVSLFAPDGRYLFNLRAPFGTLPPQGPADVESVARAAATGQPTLGPVLMGQVSKQAVIPLRVPVLRDGAVAYVLSIPLKPESLLRAEALHELVRDGGVVAVIDSRGNIVARTRGQAEYVGRPASPSLLAMMTERPQGWGASVTLDGEHTYAAYAKSSFSGLSVAIGLPSANLLAPWRRSVMSLAGGLLLALAIGAAAAVAVATAIRRPIQALADTAAAVGRGERPAPLATAMPEVREVALALAAAAEARVLAAEQREELLQRERAARAEAEAVSRSKDEFLAMLGHELRNPLGAVSNAAALLDDDRLTAAQRTAAVTILRRQSGHLKHLVDDLLDVGRVVTGKIALDARRIDLAAVTRDAVTALSVAAKLAEHTVHIDTADAWIDGDAARIQQIVSNLVANAVTYTPSGGAITVTVAAAETAATLTVADTGQGLTAAQVPRVFDLFFQAPQSVERPKSGLGIGLTLVKRLVELHGGQVTVESPGPGQGCTFTVTFPRLAAPQDTLPRVRDAAPRPLRIVVVEDNDDARDSLCALLALDGHAVSAIADGAAGLALIRAERPDAALVDIGLPGLDGYAIASAVRADGQADLLLIALTGYGLEDDVTRARAAGFNLHLTKPVDLQALAAALARRQQGEN